MKIPQHLKHHPVVSIEGYDQIDGPYSGPDSDAKGLSLGLAQWNERGNVDISAKVWRYSGKRWSRQSEELPFHRVLDLALLICQAQRMLAASPDNVSLKNPGLGALILQDQSLPVGLNAENPEIEGDLALFKKCLEENQQWIKPRLSHLSSTLKSLGF